MPRRWLALADLLTATMLANSLEIMQRLSVMSLMDGNDFQLAENQSQMVNSDDRLSAAVVILSA